MYHLKLLAAASIEGPAGPLTGRAVQRRRLALLAILATGQARGRGVGREKLVAYLWPEADGERGRPLLSDSVYRINQAVGGEAIVAMGDELRLNADIISSDVAEFERAVEAEDRERAAALYVGSLLDGVHLVDGSEFERWVDAERARLARIYEGVLDALAQNAESRGALDEAVAWWRRLAGHDPFSSRVALRLMQALAAIGDFADLVSPYLVGHSTGVADLATQAAARCHFEPCEITEVRWAALVHDIGRVAVPTRIWQKPGPLTADEREQVRLHAYHTERVMSRSAPLSRLSPVASSHHERLDGSGYHRGAVAATLRPSARLIAAADAYHAMTEPRPHRAALSADEAASVLRDEVRAGRLDAEVVAAVLDSAGPRVVKIARPAGLTEREAEVVGLLARGLQTKQIAAALGISVKTADHHVQNAYGKIGVSTRAAAALFAMEHGLVPWGELPIGRAMRHT